MTLLGEIFIILILIGMVMGFIVGFRIIASLFIAGFVFIVVCIIAGFFMGIGLTIFQSLVL